jgi:hypothetical protein
MKTLGKPLGSHNMDSACKVQIGKGGGGVKKEEKKIGKPDWKTNPSTYYLSL